jgi:hypothetical protein
MQYYCLVPPFSLNNIIYFLFQELIEPYSFIPTTNHTEESIIAPTRNPTRTNPNSYSLSRIAKKFSLPRSSLSLGSFLVVEGGFDGENYYSLYVNPSDEQIIDKICFTSQVMRDFWDQVNQGRSK